MTGLIAEVRSSMEDLLSMLPMTEVRCPCSRYQSFSFSLGFGAQGVAPRADAGLFFAEGFLDTKS